MYPEHSFQINDSHSEVILFGKSVRGKCVFIIKILFKILLKGRVERNLGLVELELCSLSEEVG